jgi:hypothetical protein
MELTLKPTELADALNFCREANLKPFVLSSPGMGKSTIIHQLAHSLGRPFRDTRLAYASPVDVRGFPILTTEANGRKVMDFAPPADYPTEPFTVWLLDEFSCAARQTQNASLQLLLEGKIGDYSAPEGTFIVLAGNRAQDRAHVEKLSAAVANRVCLITLVPDLDDWTNWACASGVDARIVAFLRYRPALLSDFDASVWDGHSGFASPRSWEFASRLLATNATGHIRAALLAGIVGQAAGVELTGFLGVCDRIPSLDAILLDPAGADVPARPDEMYAVASGIASKIEPGNVDRAMVYVNRMPKDFAVFVMRWATRRCPKICHTKPVIQWITSNKDVLVG